MTFKFKKKLDKTHIRKFLRSKKGVIVLCIIAVLIIFRLFLPLIVKNYVNKTLDRIPGYHGWVDDIDISLYRGAYVINGLHLYKDGDKKPMLDFRKTDISIEWKSLFRGRIVSEIKMYHPEVNLYVTNNKLPDSQTPGNDDWTHALKKLVPIKINRLTISDGQFLYADIIESPDINLSVHNISLVATNLGNVRDKSTVLPSEVTLNGSSLGNGNLNINGHLNVLKKIPDLDLNISLRKADVTALNSLTLASAGFDFERGQFELYSEMAINNGYLKGYLKPMFHHVRILDSLHKPNSSIIKRVWEGVITFFGFVLKNKPKDSFATKIPIEGDLNNPDTKLWALIKNIFRNGFIQPFKNEVDNNIQFSDAQPKEKKK